MLNLNYNEDKWHIKTNDDHLIHGTTSYLPNNRSSNLVIIVHGLTDHINEYRYKASIPFLLNENYEVIRFSLYTGEEKGRSLSECNLQIHADDLNEVISTYSKDYKNIFLIGFSYGAPTIFTAQPTNIAAISLWDPTYDLPKIWDIQDIQNKDKYTILNWGVEFLFNPKMIKESKYYDIEGCNKLAKQLNANVQVITAKDDIFGNDKYSWNNNSSSLSERIFIEEADHQFNNKNCFFDLVKNTIRYLNKFKESNT